jgi:hypothetical protein
MLWYNVAVAVYIKAVCCFKETLFALVYLSRGRLVCRIEITLI